MAALRRRKGDGVYNGERIFVHLASLILIELIFGWMTKSNISSSEVCME